MSDKHLPIEHQPYYHGLLPREDIREMLRKNGDFLVRTSEPHPGEPRSFILSVMFDESRQEAGIKHFVIRRSGNGFTIQKYSFESVPKMIDYHLTTRESINNAEQVIIKMPVTRQWWELSHDDIEITKKLGEGAFGEVSMGIYRPKPDIKIKVAIKQAKLESMTKEQIKEMMSEARLMRMFNHPNVVKIYGVAAGREPLMIVMELADRGALDSYLRKNPLPMKQRIEMCMGAGWGVEYLHSKNVIHRDIAARNCLYGDHKVKISDFGLTREGTIFEMDPHQRVPIRWLAPETIRTFIYSQKTDVFSYGILCWEIINQGMEPYPGMTVAEASSKIRSGYRMQFPPDTPAEFSTLVEKYCWAESSNNRWTMKQICKALERITRLPRPESVGHVTDRSVCGRSSQRHHHSTRKQMTRETSACREREKHRRRH